MRVNEQGRSMIEMLGVLAIVGVLSVGGIAGYSKAMAKFKTNKVIDQVNTISTNIRTLYSSQRNYSGLNNGTAIKMALIPSEMYQPDSQNKYASTEAVTNAFGGNTKVEAILQGTAVAGSENAYMIAIDALPKTACVSIVTTDWGGDSGSGLVAMYASSAADASVDAAKTALNKDITTNNGDSSEGTLLAVPGSDVTTPVTIGQAEKTCGDNNVIAWKFQ